MDYKQKIFRSVYVDELRSKVKKLENLEDYYQEHIDYGEDSTWLLRVDVGDEVPELNPERTSDAFNASALHSYLANLDETQASDKRLWAYLAHVPFRNYVQNRWKLPVDLDELNVSQNSKKRVADSILLHWFINGNDSRALKRHALARLWWAAHLTVAPWERSNEFESLKEDDRYVFTKFLLSNETLYTEVLERTIGNNRHILIALLQYFRLHPEQISRIYLRPIMKELILISGIKRVSLMSYDDIYALVADVSAEVISQVNESEQPIPVKIL